ncbi:MAG: efflux RND transporter periplasmic adaptor subunit, partial [Alistipes sp.]
TIVGNVSLIHPALDPTTRTFTVEVRVPNGDKKLRPGMFARAIFNMGQKEGIMVPDVAVMKQVGTAENYLYVIKEGKVERRGVKIGRQVGSNVDILSGVALGEDVAVTGLSKLSNGITVEVKNK